MIGTVISHYRILAKLGEGGMGIVYKAEDTKLDRLVALKFLPQALTADAGERERFYQEARAASQLLHPNVTAIFEINESDGQIYLAMEYVEGSTLKKRIQQDSPFPLTKALDIAIQCCSGIAAAHEKGIVHRDIKSENILLTAKGEVKITDFGLAKLKGATKLTKTGSTLGTAAYMSPEQARGEDVDARSDIFSAGVVLYELFTGKLPFRGEHQAAILYSVVNEEPPPLARFNEGLSQELQRIVSKALAKDREDRYQHADEMLADLKRERKGMEYVKSGVMAAQHPGYVTAPYRPQEAPSKNRKMVPILAAGALILIAAGLYLFIGKPFAHQDAGGPEGSKIAVLPFENIGPADKEYFADGLTDEVRTKLSGLSRLAVIARASSMQYKKTTKSIAEIGKELSVGYLLQGTIRWEEGGGASGSAVHLLVNPSLVKIADGTQVWSQSFEVTLSSVFQMQSDIAQQVARALDVVLNPADQQAIASLPTDNAEAYDSFLRGKQMMDLPSLGSIREGVAMFEKAVALDPKFAAAYAQLGRAYAFMVFAGGRPDSLLPLARRVIERSKELAPNSFLANWSEGYYYYYGFRNYDQAIEHFTAALSLQPSNADVISAIAFVKRRQGHFQESRDLLAKSCDLDPRAWRNWFELGYVEFAMRQYRAADEHMTRAVVLYGRGSPDVAAIHSLVILSMNGDLRASHELFMREAGESHTWIYRLRNAQFHILVGDLAAARSDLARSLLAEPDADSASYFAMRGTLCLRSGQTLEARAAYDSVKIIAERAITVNPDDHGARINLALSLAHLGQTARAIEQAKKLVELTPLEKDALEAGPDALFTLAEVYALTGDADASMNALERLLSVPNIYAANWIQYDPELASIAALPRFQKLMEKYKNTP